MSGLTLIVPELNLQWLALAGRRKWRVVAPVKCGFINGDYSGRRNASFEDGPATRSTDAQARVYQVDGLLDDLVGADLILEHVAVYVPGLGHYSLVVGDVALSQRFGSIAKLGKGIDVFLPGQVNADHADMKPEWPALGQGRISARPVRLRIAERLLHIPAIIALYGGIMTSFIFVLLSLFFSDFCPWL